MTSRTRNKFIEVALHLLIWVLIFGLPLLSLNHDQQHVSWNQFLRASMFPLFFALVFYTNYFLLIPRLFFSKRLIIFFLTNLLLYTACVYATESMNRHSSKLKILQSNIDKRDQLADLPKPFKRPSKTEMIARAFIAFAMTTGVAVAIQTTTKWFHSENVRKDLEREHLKSELDHLKNQLNPHFFFNTLNNIYSLIAQNQEKAQASVHQLSKLMRYLLYDSNEKFVPLTKEIEFMHHYIDLMKLRMNSGTTVHYSFPKEITGMTVAPLLFISLIENSFKHGISASKPSMITMEMKTTTTKQLMFQIKNTLFPKSDNDRSGSGIGLENLKRRLSLLYPHRHRLEMVVNDEFYQATLTIDL